jgi:hypothetical protein
MSATSPAIANGNGKGRWLGGLLLTGGAGVGAAVGFALIEVLRDQPHETILTIGRWGPLFVIVVIGMIMAQNAVNTWGPRILEAAMATARSQQQLADAVKEIADRDDRERHKLAVLTGTICSQQEEILDKQDRVIADIGHALDVIQRHVQESEIARATAAGGPRA